MNRNLNFCFAMLVLAGCASANVGAPAIREIQKTITVDQAYEQTWRKSVSWFANNNIIIDKVEKESGLITAKYTLAVGDAVVDCGSISMTGVIGTPEIQRFANLNVTLSPSGGNSTTASMNIFGEFEATGRDAWDGRIVKLAGKCVSTGQLERDFFGEITG